MTQDGTAGETPAKTLDVRGLKCPLPVLKARKAITGIPVGGLLEVLATDPAATLDFRHYARHSGHTLIAAEEGAELRFLLRRES